MTDGDGRYQVVGGIGREGGISCVQVCVLGASVEVSAVLGYVVVAEAGMQRVDRK